MSVVAIIPAAGEGRRMGGAVEKQFLCLRGIPVLAYTLEVFDRSPVVDEIVLVAAGERRQALEEIVLDPYPCSKPLQVVNGGQERQQSVACGLAAVSPQCKVVVVHDGVRPLITHELLGRVLETARNCGAALAAMPARDTVKQAEEGWVRTTLERGTIWLAQTPQAFHVNLLRRAYEEAGNDRITATDDAALVERLGIPVRVVLGSAENIKVTIPDDLVVAEALLAQRDKGELGTGKGERGIESSGQRAAGSAGRRADAGTRGRGDEETTRNGEGGTRNGERKN